MRLVVVIPSLDYVANAGARIRYGRLVAGFAERGISLALEPIAGFDPTTAHGDAVVFSKCHDARAIICARMLSQRGIPVGVDVFDDYFSQAADSRLNRLRSWLSQMVDECSFALTSTSATADLVRHYAPALPVHLLNDPAPAFDARQLADRLREKRSQTIASGRLKIAWFGMGDNPHFAVGLRDLSAFAPILSALSAANVGVELTILTNRRSLDAAGLERIANLPVAATVELWSEEREAALLDEALVAFLPVNANRFSRAKSLNRAVTALSAGCQVLSAGYPLYAALAPLIYRTTEDFLRDLRENRLRLSATTLDAMEERFAELASVEREIAGLLQFLAEIKGRPRDLSRSCDAVYLVHGMETNIAAHDLVASLGGVSVATPFCAAPFDFDVMFAAQFDGGLAMFVARKALARLIPPARKTSTKPVTIKGHKYWEVTPPNAAPDFVSADDGPLPLQLALYPSVMDEVARLLIQYFDANCIISSEHSDLPLDRAVTHA